MRRLTSPTHGAPWLLLSLAAACASAPARYVSAPGDYAYNTGHAENDVAAAPCFADSWAHSDRAVACDVRTFVLAPARGPVDLESGNGSVTVEGTDTARAATVQARVRAWAPTDADAARLLAEIAIRADGNALRIDGRATERPTARDGRWTIG